MPDITSGQLAAALGTAEPWVTPVRSIAGGYAGLAAKIARPDEAANWLLAWIERNYGDVVDAHICCGPVDDDTELSVMARIVRLMEAGTPDGHAVIRALYPLDGPALVRVLRWLLARFPADPPS